MRTPVGGQARSQRRMRWLRVAVFVFALVPLARLVVLGALDALTANPVEFVQRSTGTWALAMLCITLAVTPLRRLSGWGWLMRLRRMLGLFAFFYACLHLLAYAWLDQWFDWNAIVDDVLDRPFITVGMTAFLLLIPLAMTSTNAMMRRLGRRWQELHRLVYAIAVLAVLHYWWHKAGKNDFSAPLAWALVVGGLLALRLTWHWARPPAQAARGAQGARRTPGVARPATARRAALPASSLRQAPLERE
ncbi:MAG: sulfoxide reductase heme-binding subunit YedZ [Burkholderiaceae bacterium]|nr:sulfoxide reductase heme-binding subunit YedZ [Burkholderiaceae bacterium]